MVITEVEVCLAENHARLRAFVRVVLDGMFVLKDLRVIERSDGKLFVAMPCRIITDHCHCGAKNILTNRYCGRCGDALPENRAARREDGRLVLHADIFHPVDERARFALERVILEAYLERRMLRDQGRLEALRGTDLPWWGEEEAGVEFLELSA